MKLNKVISLVVSLLMTVTLVACGDSKSNSVTRENVDSKENISEQVSPTKMEQESTPTNEVVQLTATPTLAPTVTPRPTLAPGEEPVVYMTSDISPEGLKAVYDALGWEPEGNVAVKLSTGEPPRSYYLKPELIKDLVQSLNATIVECNTAYGGKRIATEMHMQVAKDHGFTDIAEVDILDAEGSMILPVVGGTHLKENLVGSHFANYDSYLVLSHFKGHEMAGYGGAIKNISIGFGSQKGKSLIHTAGKSEVGIYGDQDDFLESMGDAGKSVADSLGDHIVYINVLNNISIDCDCNGYPKKPDIHDIGILASTDPVALDQACIDLVYAAEGNESLIRRIELKNGLHTLEHAEQIGLGYRVYQLVNVDD